MPEGNDTIDINFSINDVIKVSKDRLGDIEKSPQEQCKVLLGLLYVMQINMGTKGTKEAIKQCFSISKKMYSDYLEREF
jgi:hypothetical protein